MGRILASSEAFALLGAPGNGGSKVVDLAVNVHGDLAYTTAVFVASPAFGAERVNVTNVLERVDGVSKVVHHHADKSPGLAAAITKLIEQQSAGIAQDDERPHANSYISAVRFERYSSTRSATWRPSAIAHTTSDAPRVASPAAKTPGTRVAPSVVDHVAAGLELQPSWDDDGLALDVR